LLFRNYRFVLITAAISASRPSEIAISAIKALEARENRGS
jgi:hypothetical protein